jgi:hypothetical protein
MVASTKGLRPKKDLRWQGPAAYIRDRPDLSSERAPHRKEDRKGQDSNTYLIMSTRWGSTPRFTD